MKIALFLILFSLSAFCDISIFISENNQLTSISQEELANLYLKKTDSINGIKVIPIDSTDEKIYQEFYKKVVNKTPSQLHAYWMKQIYSGKKQPPKRLSNSELQKEMQKNKKIIAYSISPINGKVLLTIK